jgi:4a-hydroxytetrahydrobiopterin dehydratase
MPTKPKLSESEIDAALRAAPHWRREDRTIVRDVKTHAFSDGVRLVGEIAVLADASEHHPDVELSYGKVRFSLTTHDAGGLTELDFGLARHIDSHLERTRRERP